MLITGENGSGKELVARAIHEASARKTRPFVEVNCAAIPSELVESELFGHVKGSFTGATADQPGRFEAADGGTLFLDEIGDLALPAQAKILRALQEGVIVRVGDNRTIAVDVRVIAATNRDLADEIAAGRFREDLYFRLNVMPIHVPPLRERREDIPALVSHFVSALGHRPRHDAEAVQRTPPCGCCSVGSWPGNVRELRNAVERLLILAAGAEVGEEDIEAVLAHESGPPIEPEQLAADAGDRNLPGISRGCRAGVSPRPAARASLECGRSRPHAGNAPLESVQQDREVRHREGAPMTDPRNWDKELAEIDKLMAADRAPSARERPPAKARGGDRDLSPGSLGRTNRHRDPRRATPSASGCGRCLARSAPAALAIWPYPKSCGSMLYLYLGGVAAVILGSAATPCGTPGRTGAAWRTSSGSSILLAGLTLAAAEILPRTGYAAVAHSWTCP